MKCFEENGSKKTEYLNKFVENAWNEKEEVSKDLQKNILNLV